MKDFILIIISCFIISCNPEENDLGPNFIDPNPNDVEIRIHNKTAYQMDSVYLNTSGGENYYNTLRFLGTSTYSSFQFSYPIFNFKFKVADKLFSLTPIDYIGEKKVENGRYTIEISGIDTSAASFSYQFHKD